MSWNDVAQIASLMLLGGFIVSGVVSDIARRISQGRVELAKIALEMTKTQAEAHKTAHERMPWDVR